jgi:hypothetical protein
MIRFERDDLHKALKALAADHGLTLGAALTEAVERYLEEGFPGGRFMGDHPTKLAPKRGARPGPKKSEKSAADDEAQRDHNRAVDEEKARLATRQTFEANLGDVSTLKPGDSRTAVMRPKEPFKSLFRPRDLALQERGTKKAEKPKVDF